MVASGKGRRWLILTLITCHIPCFLVQARPSFRRIPEHHDIGTRDALSDSGLESASWIWTSDATTGNVAFMRTFITPPSKTAISATIWMVAVNHYTLWVNGNPIGASGEVADNWKSAQVLSAALNATTNTISVLAVNNANASAAAPGFLAAIRVNYSDGSSDFVVSDSEWAVSAVIPSDFPTPSDNSRFTAATLLAPFGSGSWGAVAVPFPDPDAATLSNGTWIWSTPDANQAALPGTVGFRKTFTTPTGRTALSATVLITVDNQFALYLNGDYVGSPPADFMHAQQFTVNLSAVSNTFTVIAQNFAAPNTDTVPSPAGVIAMIRIQYSDRSSEVVGTDTSWLSGAFTSVPEFLATADTALSATYDIGKMGAQPWGSLSGISNALAAAQVPSGPFANGTIPTSGASSTSSSSAAGPHIALILGPTIGVFVLLVGVAVFWWLRRRNAQRHAILAGQPFVAGTTHSHDERSEGAGSASQSATSHRYAQSPEPYRLPPAMQFVSYAPQPQGIIPPTKLANEHLIWERNATAASSAANTNTMVDSASSGAPGSESQLEAHPGRVEAGTLGTTPDPPPRYRSMAGV
ncbi:hypothetical protein FB451DRAFT_48189 [Mycena latifolia]|nr:hypothetical protein FB451DRAFT_48189 [Mycena latifolia]